MFLEEAAGVSKYKRAPPRDRELRLEGHAREPGSRVGDILRRARHAKLDAPRPAGRDCRQTYNAAPEPRLALKLHNLLAFTEALRDAPSRKKNRVQASECPEASPSALEAETARNCARASARWRTLRHRALPARRTTSSHAAQGQPATPPTRTLAVSSSRKIAFAMCENRRRMGVAARGPGRGDSPSVETPHRRCNDNGARPLAEGEIERRQGSRSGTDAEAMSTRAAQAEDHCTQLPTFEEAVRADAGQAQRVKARRGRRDVRRRAGPGAWRRRDESHALEAPVARSEGAARHRLKQENMAAGCSPSPRSSPPSKSGAQVPAGQGLGLGARGRKSEGRLEAQLTHPGGAERSTSPCSDLQEQIEREHSAKLAELSARLEGAGVAMQAKARQTTRARSSRVARARTRLGPLPSASGRQMHVESGWDDGGRGRARAKSLNAVEAVRRIPTPCPPSLRDAPPSQLRRLHRARLDRDRTRLPSHA